MQTSPNAAIGPNCAIGPDWERPIFCRCRLGWQCSGWDIRDELRVNVRPRLEQVAIQHAIVNGFLEMHRRNIRGVFQICDGSGDA